MAMGAITPAVQEGVSEPAGAAVVVVVNAPLDVTAVVQLGAVRWPAEVAA